LITKTDLSQISPFFVVAKNIFNCFIIYFKFLNYYRLLNFYLFSPDWYHKLFFIPINYNMNLRFLPQEWLGAISKTDSDKLNEIRLRANQPTMVCVGGKKFYLNSNGVSQEAKNALVASNQILERILLAACQKSIYAYNFQIVQGYLSVEGGIRIGVCGNVTMENGKILAVKEISALNIRIPHIVKDCSKPVLKHLKPLCNLLVVSPPGCGKTTFLRDLIFQHEDKRINILLCDERNEISASTGGVSQFGLKDCDIYIYGEKSYVFEAGIRSMSPELIICDEILPSDMPYITAAAQSGVNVFASMHGRDVIEVTQKIGTNTVFDRYVVLSNRNGVGTIEGVFDKELKKL